MTQQKTATVFGGTGFVGTQVVRELAARGVTVKVATRVPERAYFLKPCGAVGQIVPVPCDYSDPASVAGVVAGSDYVVNCIGVLAQRRRAKFQSVHVDLPARIAKACADEGVGRFVHISALACERGTSQYAKSKAEGEQAVHANFSAASLLRPSVIFGEGDDFFNMFAKMSKILPVLPLIGGGKTRFQPVYVGDVADAVMAALEREDAKGKIYELAGPEILSFEEIYQRLFAHTGRKACLISLPFALAKMDAAVLSVLPKPPLTCDQVESLKTDNVVNEGALGLADLGVSSTALDTILPTYLSRYRKGGRFGDQKAA
ncbi:MAG: complex I NDUFA9 subunit family protein [Bdellovibrionales bacterium]